MKQTFQGFYTPNEDDIKASWSSEKTLFVFDTNVLLNLYAYTEDTRKDFFKILDKVSENVWLPYHVGLEYQRNRLNVIKNEKAIFPKIEKYLDNIKKQVDNNTYKDLKLAQRLPSLNSEAEELHQKILDLLLKYENSVNEWNKKQPEVRSTDKIRQKIDKVFDGKIGSPPKDQAYLDTLFDEGKERYINLVPPGYKDKKEKEAKEKFTYSGLTYIPMYGDLIIWKQMLDKSLDEDIESIIFVTDDAKEDWQYIIDSNGKKTIGARPELRDEIYINSNIVSFEILQTTDFMERGQKFLELKLKDESINEVKLNLELLKAVEERKEELLHKRLRFEIENEKKKRKKLFEEQRQLRREYEEELRFERETEWRYEQEEEFREERDDERRREYEEEMRHEREMEWRHEQEEELRREMEAEWRREQEDSRGL